MKLPSLVAIVSVLGVVWAAENNWLANVAIHAFPYHLPPGYQLERSAQGDQVTVVDPHRHPMSMGYVKFVPSRSVDGNASEPVLILNVGTTEPCRARIHAVPSLQLYVAHFSRTQNAIVRRKEEDSSQPPMPLTRKDLTSSQGTPMQLDLQQARDVDTRRLQQPTDSLDMEKLLQMLHPVNLNADNAFVVITMNRRANDEEQVLSMLRALSLGSASSSGGDDVEMGGN